MLAMKARPCSRFASTAVLSILAVVCLLPASPAQSWSTSADASSIYATDLQSGSMYIDRYPALSHPRSTREQDWRTRLALQRQKVDDLEAELAPLEREYQRVGSQCAWKQCQVMAWTDGGAGNASSGEPPDKAYLAFKDSIETKRQQLADAQRELDSMVSQANEELERR